MTSKASLPEGVFDLWAALDSGPAAAHEVCSAVMVAVQSRYPRMTFNNSMRGLRSQPSRPLHALRDWLNGPEAYRQASRVGAYWALRKWQHGLDRMIDHGVAAHKAFGGDKPGRQTHKRFSWAERAAIHCECRSRAGIGLKKALAEFTSRTHAGLCPTLDESDVRRARKGLQLKGLTDSEIRTLATGSPAP